MRPHRIIVMMLGLTSVLSLRSFGCTRVSGPPVKVKSTFVVFIHDPNSKPLSGAEIRIEEFIRKPPHLELVTSALTNKDGKAEIKGLHDNYSIRGMIAGVSSEVIQIDVYDDSSGGSEVSLTWPGGPITQIQNVSGILGEGSGRVPWVGTIVALRGPNGEVGKKVTDSQGRFSFNGIAPGFYTLHVKDSNAATTPSPVSQREGDVPIEVRKDATNIELPLWGFVAISCGLSAYTDANSMIIFAP